MFATQTNRFRSAEGSVRQKECKTHRSRKMLTKNAGIMRTIAAVGTFQYRSCSEYGTSHAASKVTEAIFWSGESGQESPCGSNLICSAASAIHISGHPASVETAFAT